MKLPEIILGHGRWEGGEELQGGKAYISEVDTEKKTVALGVGCEAGMNLTDLAQQLMH